MFNPFRRKTPPPPPTPFERFEAALEEATAAWEAHRIANGTAITPWIDWPTKEIYLVERERSPARKASK